MNNKLSKRGKPVSAADPCAVLHGAILATEGGVVEAGRQIGRSPGVMYNKLNESNDGHLGLREALALARWVRDLRGCTEFAEAVARDFGGVFVPLPDAGEAADDDVLSAFLHASISLGELSRELVQAREDGVLDAMEFEEIKMVASRHVAVIQQAMQVLATQVRDVPLHEPVGLHAQAGGVHALKGRAA
jgi:hypothetical protein